MTQDDKNTEIRNVKETAACIIFGTLVGTLTYWVFCYLKIAIFGWNFGLVFAPLFAGYSETWLARKLIDEETGAISALILFVLTTVYSFVLINPTFGANLLTFGILIIILQAAIPTAINYILIVVLLRGINDFIGFFKKIFKPLNVRNKKRKNEEAELTDVTPVFDEIESNERINNLGVKFITGADILDIEYKSLGPFYSTVFLEKDKILVNAYYEQSEKKTLYNLKKAKDECLVKLSDNIKKAGGNCILNLEISYNLNGNGGGNFQINAVGTGIKIITS